MSVTNIRDAAENARGLIAPRVNLLDSDTETLIRIEVLLEEILRRLPPLEKEPEPNNREIGFKQ